MRAGLCARLPALLRHGEAGVRAKTCSLLGNLCRHSAAFYTPVARAGLLPLPPLLPQPLSKFKQLEIQFLWPV